MASPVPPTVDHGAPRPLPTLSDELLEEIFLRLPSPTDLARACTACASFRRIITDLSFLRRFRAIHPPPLLGFLGYARFHPAVPPHPSAPLARALADAADFSYSFVPTARCLERWSPQDVRQGRVLLWSIFNHDFNDGLCNPELAVCDPFCRRYVKHHFNNDLCDLELAVCDPLCRRYVLLPPIPDELTAEHGQLIDFGAVLAATREDEEETSFRVICTARNENKLFAFIFSSGTGQWLMAASPSLSSLGTSTEPRCKFGFTCFDYARGSLYFTVHWRGKLLVLDPKMGFSIINNVPIHYGWDHGQPCVVEGAEGSLMMAFLNDGNGDDSADLIRITKLDDSEPSGRWHLENIIPLPTQYRYSQLVGAAEGILFLRVCGYPRDMDSVHSDGFSDYEILALDINTSKFKKVCGMGHYVRVHAYFGFPPSLSKPCL